MIPRIIVSIILTLLIAFAIEIFIPLYKMITRAESIFWIFEKLFDIYPEERENLFPSGDQQTIKCGKIKFECSGIQEACIKFEEQINELLECYEKHRWIVNSSHDLQSNIDKLCEIRTSVRWLRKR